jgi:two-component system, sensor histidine kinase LadS
MVELKKIFIVEDASIVAMELRRILESIGYGVIGMAGSGEEAIDLCLASPPDLILMDVKLPGKLNGIEASREIRKHINVPVIYTTAYSDSETVKEVQKSYPFGFVIKPYREKDLLVAIETAFTRYEYERKLEISETKYKSLFEGSSDIIFTLDEDFTILTVNGAIMNYLNLNPEEVISRNLMDLLSFTSEGETMQMDFAREKLDSFVKSRRPQNFKTVFKVKYNHEPIEMNVRLEFINIPDGRLIMGRAFRVVEDELLKFFVSEEQNMVMGNQLFLVGDITFRMTRNLKRYFDADTVELMRMALVEMIVNAIEHGNLEISFDEKSEALKSSNYFDFINHRQANPSFRERRVRIEYSITPDEAWYIITDDGSGFNHEELFKRDIAEINMEMGTHGRGVFLAAKIFDEVRYSDEGNRVMLVKRIERAGGN